MSARSWPIGVWRGGRWSINLGVGRYWCSVNLTRLRPRYINGKIGVAVALPFVAFGWFAKKIPAPLVVEAMRRCGVTVSEASAPGDES